MSSSSRSSKSNNSEKSETFTIKEINSGYKFNINIIALILFFVFIYYKLYGTFDSKLFTINNVKKIIFTKLDSVIHPITQQP